jgi:hypothetical protein
VTFGDPWLGCSGGGGGATAGPRGATDGASTTPLKKKSKTKKTKQRKTYLRELMFSAKPIYYDS